MALFGKQQSETNLGSPFGGLPQRLANLQAGQLSPLLRGFGLGAGPNFGRFQERLARGQGPLADYIQQVQGFAPGVFGQAEAAGQRVSAEGSAAYEQLQGQIQQALGALPEYQQAADQGLGYAQRYASEAYGPTRDQPLYLEASRRMLDQIRPGLAARGIEGAGAGQQAESDAMRDLSLSFAQQQRSDQAQAPGLLQQAAGGAQQLSQAGVGLAGTGFDAVSQFGNYLQQAYGIPMEAMGNLLNLLTGGQTGAQNLVGLTSPVALPSSKGYNVL